jgi:hypothetical protein
MFRRSQERNSVVKNRGLEAERDSEQGICPIRSDEEYWSHTLRCEGTQIGGTRFWTRGL